MKYLFWNTHNNENINPILCDLIIENHISVVVLAEYTANIDNLTILLHDAGAIMNQASTQGCDRIRILKEAGICIMPELQSDHTSTQIIGGNTILCCVHLNSQIYSDNIERREIDIEQIICDIRILEKKLNTKQTIVVGDFNVNPYDKSCVSARYFHGIPIYEEATRKSRIVAGKEFEMFYNPMWNFLGDFDEPYGTYYCNSGDTVNPYWNVYDQVIIRPALRKRFVNDNLRIITGTAKLSLLDEKRHPDCSISDHLPITFEIMEDEHE